MIMMEIAKIIKNNISLDILRQNIFQTDQKKQPCLAVKACQLRTKFQFCFRENLQNWFNNRMRNLIHQLVYIWLVHSQKFSLHW